MPIHVALNNSEGKAIFYPWSAWSAQSAVCVFRAFGPSRMRGQKCLFMSKICQHNGKPSAIGLFTNGQNSVADGQTSKMPSTTSGASQTVTNLGKQKRGCLVSEMI